MLININIILVYHTHINGFIAMRFVYCFDTVMVIAMLQMSMPTLHRYLYLTSVSIKPSISHNNIINNTVINLHCTALKAVCSHNATCKAAIVIAVCCSTILFTKVVLKIIMSLS